ncbi:MAG: hypothetical protein HUU29_10765 [Planctomycetaceae bacterium]|nr:hypothetical protein [Planctomycetaceae bacterium]
MARIICGTNELDDARWDGKTIAEIRRECKSFLNIPDGARVLLNDDEFVGTEDRALGSDDELEFVKASGEKGYSPSPRFLIPSREEPNRPEPDVPARPIWIWTTPDNDSGGIAIAA